MLKVNIYRNLFGRVITQSTTQNDCFIHFVFELFCISNILARLSQKKRSKVYFVSIIDLYLLVLIIVEECFTRRLYLEITSVQQCSLICVNYNINNHNIKYLIKHAYTSYNMVLHYCNYRVI